MTIIAKTAQSAATICGRITTAVITELAAGKTAKKAAENVAAAAVAEAVTCGWSEADQARLVAYTVQATATVVSTHLAAAEVAADAAALVAGALK